MLHSQSVLDDSAQLAALGIAQELRRNFTPLSMLGLSFALLNSWTVLAVSLPLALPSGGPTSVIWGFVTAAVCNLAVAASLAEFLSACPSAGGQYHWVAMVAWEKWRHVLSWTTGWINVFGWMSLTATGGLFASQLIVGMISLYNPDYAPQRWQEFLIYLAYAFASAAIVALASNLLPGINSVAISWSILGFLIISITVLACAAPDFHSAEFVFTDFINATGWPDGIAWLLGLLQGSLGLAGYDAVAHMIEEVPNAAINGPRITVLCVAIGTLTGLPFLIILLFVAGDINDVITSPFGPLGEIIFHATKYRVSTVCLQLFPLVSVFFAQTAVTTTSSRMTYAFARDGGLPFSRIFSRVHLALNTPLEALALTESVVVVIGLIFLGSTTAFNALASASVVALQVSYGIPIAINCLRGRKMLPADRPFCLPGWLAWPTNLLSLVYILLTTVLFVFPPALPVTGSTMNYCIVVFTIVLGISTWQWFFDGRKNYAGPKVDVDVAMLVGAAIVPDSGNKSQDQ